MAGPALCLDSPPLPGHTPGLPVRALVLDDSAFDRSRVARLLRKVCGTVSVRDAADIPEFREALDEDDFDLILIDYLLVGETGLTAVDVLACHPRQSGSTAIMVAGEGNLDVALTAMRRGCTDYIPKTDLSVDGLRDVLARSLKRTFDKVAVDAPPAVSSAVDAASLRYAAAAGAAAGVLGQEILSRIAPLCTRTSGLIGREEVRRFRDIEMTAEQLVEIMNNLAKLNQRIEPTGRSRAPSLSECSFEGMRPN